MSCECGLGRTVSPLESSRSHATHWLRETVSSRHHGLGVRHLGESGSSRFKNVFFCGAKLANILERFVRYERVTTDWVLLSVELCFRDFLAVDFEILPTTFVLCPWRQGTLEEATNSTFLNGRRSTFPASPHSCRLPVSLG